ncbi:putative F-box/LRR-repeat protein At3g18150 isoform X1 [Carex rostrata]
MNKVEVDSTSRLPDEVLTHILSFLTTKEAVQTCVLSKRWINIWAVVPILDINHYGFEKVGVHDCSAAYDGCSGGCKNALIMSVVRFERLMTGFLDNRAPTNLERFCCARHIHNFEHDASVGWIDRVALLMPLDIDILITGGTDNSLDLPDLVFSCTSLQYLNIALYTRVKTIIRPVSINLPSLKFLELTWVELPDDFAQKFFIGCPSLERLKLCSCDLYFSDISSEVLKELTLINCTLYEQMQISCPHLISLCMTINLKRDGISLKNMSCLVNVNITLFGDDVPNLNLLGGLSNAAKLVLHIGTPVLKEQLEKDIPNCRIFNNLKKLVVGGKCDMFYDFHLIAFLLKHSPNLKELELLPIESQGQIQEPRQDISGDVLFQCEYLETVKICNKCRYKLSSELINAVIKTLGIYVKQIGNMIIV